MTTQVIHRNRGSRGIALILVVVMIAFSGLAVMAIGSSFASESRRTTVTRKEAQLRQLLLAGAVDALSRMSKEGAAIQPANQDLPLPAGLRQQGATVHVEVNDNPSTQKRHVRIVAAMGQSVAEQEMILTHDNTGWHLTDARLLAINSIHRLINRIHNLEAEGSRDKRVLILPSRIGLKNRFNTARVMVRGIADGYNARRFVHLSDDLGGLGFVASDRNARALTPGLEPVD